MESHEPTLDEALTEAIKDTDYFQAELEKVEMERDGWKQKYDEAIAALGEAERRWDELVGGPDGLVYVDDGETILGLMTKLGESQERYIGLYGRNHALAADVIDLRERIDVALRVLPLVRNPDGPCAPLQRLVNLVRGLLAPD